MKKKLLVACIILVLFGAGAGGYIYYQRLSGHKKAARGAGALLTLLAAEESSSSRDSADIPLGTPAEGTPVDKDDAPEYAREYMVDTDRLVYNIHEAPDLIIIDSRPKSRGRTSLFFRENHMPGALVTDKQQIGSFVLEKGHDLQWLRDKKGALLWAADLTDPLHSKPKRDTVYDAEDGPKQCLLTLVTTGVTVLHANERLTLDTRVRTLEDGRAVIVRRTLREYLRSFNIGSEDPVPVSGRLTPSKAEVTYGDGTRETFDR